VSYERGPLNFVLKNSNIDDLITPVLSSKKDKFDIKRRIILYPLTRVNYETNRNFSHCYCPYYFGLNSVADQIDFNVQKSIQLARNGESGGGNCMDGPKRTRA
jgi:hypothetical protein